MCSGHRRSITATIDRIDTGFTAIINNYNRNNSRLLRIIWYVCGLVTASVNGIYIKVVFCFFTDCSGSGILSLVNMYRY